MNTVKKSDRHIFLLNKDGIHFRHSRAPGSVAITSGALFHTHSFPEITYIVEGYGYHITENTEYELKQNTLILTPPGVHHKIKVDPDKIYDRFYLGIDHVLLEDMDIENIYKNIEVIDCSNNPDIPDIFRRADRYADKFDEEIYYNIAKCLVKELFYNLGIFENIKNVKSRSIHPILLKATEYINCNLLTIGSVKEISDSLFITERYLYELFKNELSTSPKKYINEKRLHFARQEILNGEKPGDVYFKAGFSDYSTFYRSYKKEFGNSPSKEFEKR